MLKIDGGSSKIHKQTETVTKPKFKPSTTNSGSRPDTNAAVYAKGNQNTQHASLLKFKLNTQVALSAAQKAPTITPQEAEDRANQIIADNGGKGNLNTDGVGRDLAEIARQNPADAWAVSQAMLGTEIDQDGKGKVKENDKDEIAQSFANALSDNELTTIGQNSDGKAMLERFSTHLLSGNVHGDERDSALRLQTGARGYPPPQLTGNPEQDIQTVADDLRNILPDKRDEYLMEVLDYPMGGEILQRAGLLSSDDRDILADTLNEAYTQNPSKVRDVLNATLDTPTLLPISEQAGLADVIGRTGNDDLIAGYAKHAMNIANSEGIDTYSDTSAVNALTALGGMSPEGLRNFINFGSAEPPQYGSPSTIGRFIEQNKENFSNLLTNAIDNYQPWIVGNAVGDILNTASQMTDANGKLSSEALNIFSAVVPRFSEDVFANGAISDFFLAHSDQILESLLQTNSGQAVLQEYFKNTLFSVDTPPDVRTKIEDAVSNYVGDQVANSGTDAPLVGDKIGELFGTIQAAGREALAAASGAEKDRIKEFTVGVLSKAVGALVGKGITALGTSVGGPAGTAAGIAANAIVGQILSNVFKVSNPDPQVLADQFIADLEAAGGDINLGENLLEDLNDKFNQVLAQLNAEIEKTNDPAVREQLDEARTRLEQLLRSMNDSYQIKLND